MPSYLKALDWHCWPAGCNDLYREERDRGCAIGSPVKMSENLGDGKWCEKCRETGHYTWLDLVDGTRNVFEQCYNQSKGWHK